MDNYLDIIKAQGEARNQATELKAADKPQTAERITKMSKEIMITIGKMTEQETLMDMLDRDDQMVEDTVDFLRNFWKKMDER